MTFNHIGYAVKNLIHSKNYFESLNYKSSKIFHDKIQQIDIILMEQQNSPIIELIHPLGNNNPLNRYFISSERTVPYHIAFSVNNIYKKIEELRKKSFVPCIKISNAVAFNNAPFIFLTNQNTGLIELLQLK